MSFLGQGRYRERNGSYEEWSARKKKELERLIKRHKIKPDDKERLALARQIVYRKTPE